MELSNFERPAYPDEASETRGENVRAYVRIAEVVGYLALYAIDAGYGREETYDAGREGLARRTF